MHNIYSLRIYDTELMSFSLEVKGVEGLVADILSVNEANAHLLPLDMERSEDGLVHWLTRRVIPKNRAFVEQILASLALSINDTKGIIDICKGLSFNDSYWIVPKHFDGSFGEYNLFENRFSEILSLVAYTGIGQSHGEFSTSPELTTNGMLPKGWRLIEGDGIYLYKGGTTGAANTGNEPFSEFYACQIAERMGLTAVHYDLEEWKGILASKCALFTDKDTAFVPIGRVVRAGGLKACMDYYEQLGESFAEQLRSMLVFDALIYNEDRHFGNFGLLRDNKSGRILCPAPIFDNGLSLFNFAMASDIKDIDAYAKTRSTPYRNITYEAICREYLGSSQAEQLRRIEGFRFVRHEKYNLPEDRLAAIEAKIQKRAQELLRIPIKTKTAEKEHGHTR